MAARLKNYHQDEIRAKIQTSQLINRLENCALGDLELTAQQLKAIEILLKKNLPDLSQLQISGDADSPLEHRLEFIWKSGA